MFEKLRELLSRRPFEPFRVVLSSGTTYDVPHPEFAWLLKGGLYVGLPGEGNGYAEDVPEQSVFCSMLHIAAVEPALKKRRKSK